MISVNYDFLGFVEVMFSVFFGFCNFDVVCGFEDGWGIVDCYWDIIQLVVVYGQGGDIFCIGFLVNNICQDCIFYFMMVNYCGISVGGVFSVVVYWNYMNSFCCQFGSFESGFVGNGLLSNFNIGFILRVFYSFLDMMLLELDDFVFLLVDVFFVGWDVCQIFEFDIMICVYYFDGEEKCISFEFDGVYCGVWG